MWVGWGRVGEGGCLAAVEAVGVGGVKLVAKRVNDSISSSSSSSSSIDSSSIDSSSSNKIVAT